MWLWIVLAFVLGLALGIIVPIAFRWLVTSACEPFRYLSLIGALGLLVLASGCGDLKAVGVSRWPMIQAPAPLEYTAEEEAALVEFSSARPELARKIVNQSQAMRAAITEYNRRAWDVNQKQLKTLGYSDEEIVRLLGEKPK